MSKIFIRTFSLGIIFIVIVSAKTSFLSTQNENFSKDKDYGDTLVVGTIADASLLVPMLATDAMSHTVADKIFRGIVKYAPDLTIVGDLAEKFEISKDQRSITFYLKKGS